MPEKFYPECVRPSDLRKTNHKLYSTMKYAEDLKVFADVLLGFCSFSLTLALLLHSPVFGLMALGPLELSLFFSCTSKLIDRYISDKLKKSENAQIAEKAVPRA